MFYNKRIANSKHSSVMKRKQTNVLLVIINFNFIILNQV